MRSKVLTHFLFLSPYDSYYCNNGTANRTMNFHSPRAEVCTTRVHQQNGASYQSNVCSRQNWSDRIW